MFDKKTSNRRRVIDKLQLHSIDSITHIVDVSLSPHIVDVRARQRGRGTRVRHVAVTFVPR